MTVLLIPPINVVCSSTVAFAESKSYLSSYTVRSTPIIVVLSAPINVVCSATVTLVESSSVLISFAFRSTAAIDDWSTDTLVALAVSPV